MSSSKSVNWTYLKTQYDPDVVSIVKECVNKAVQKAYYSENRVEILLKRREYYNENREKILERNKEYHKKKNKE